MTMSTDSTGWVYLDGVPVGNVYEHNKTISQRYNAHDALVAQNKALREVAEEAMVWAHVRSSHRTLAPFADCPADECARWRKALRDLEVTP